MFLSFEIDIFKGIILLLVGIFAGFFNILAGGGSMLTLPLMIFFGVPAQISNGTNRLALIFQNVSSLIFLHKGKVSQDFPVKKAVIYFVFMLPGALFGVVVAVSLSASEYAYLLGISFLFLLIFMLFKEFRGKNNGEWKVSNKHPILSYFFMLISGFWGGLIQAGVGFIITFSLYTLGNWKMQHTAIYRIISITFYNLIVLPIFIVKGLISLPVLLLLICGNILGGYFASKLIVKKGEKVLKIAFYLCIITSIIILFFFKK